MIDEKYLTARVNNLLSLVLGVPTLLFAAVVLATSALPDRTGFVGLIIVGAVY